MAIYLCGCNYCANCANLMTARSPVFAKVQKENHGARRHKWKKRYSLKSEQERGCRYYRFRTATVIVSILIYCSSSVLARVCMFNLYVGDVSILSLWEDVTSHSWQQLSCLIPQTHFFLSLDYTSIRFVLLLPFSHDDVPQKHDQCQISLCLFSCY